MIRSLQIEFVIHLFTIFSVPSVENIQVLDNIKLCDHAFNADSVASDNCKLNRIV
jgi:hypothetical protein